MVEHASSSEALLVAGNPHFVKIAALLAECGRDW